MARRAPKKTTKKAVRRALPPPPPSPGLTRWAVDVPFAWRAWAASQGVAWDATRQMGFFDGVCLPETLAPFAPKPFSWEWNQQAQLQGASAPLVRGQPPFKPRAHQELATRAAQAARRQKSPGFLIADDVGVGKTLSAWGVADDASVSSVLVVTTAPATAHWRHTILHAGWRSGQGILVINYDRLGKLFVSADKPLSSNRAKGKRKRLAREGAAPAFDLVIFDESHKGKDPTSARGMMMQKLADEAGFVLWLSATAGQDPIQLGYLGRLLAHRLGKTTRGMDEFGVWCQAQGLGVKKGAYGAWVWDKSAKDCETIRHWLFDGPTPIGIRRLPQDIAGWPAMVRQAFPVDLDFEDRKAYEETWAAFQTHQLRLPPLGQRSRAEAESALVEQLRFRQKSSWLRAPSTVALTLEALESSQQVAVSVAFHDTLERMAQALTAAKVPFAVIHGKLGPDEKERERLRFQRGEAVVVLFTVEEAISLHQGEHNDVPRVMLVHDLRWSALQMTQIEGRCHRDGALAPIRWLYAADTVEERLVRVLTERVIAMKAMHGDPAGDLAAIEAALAEK